MSLLQQDFDLSFDYTRSTGPIVGEFLTQLRARRIVGIRMSDGRVTVPPLEYDPFTAEALSKIVPVKDTGVVKHWCWVHQPREKHPLQKPFAWALICLDGADYPMPHAVDAVKQEHMRVGLKVRARWAKETKGMMTDIACFEVCE